MFKFIQDLTVDESGAVSIDWVVLTAAVVAIGVATGIAIRPALQTTTELVAPAAAQVSVGTAF